MIIDRTKQYVRLRQRHNEKAEILRSKLENRLATLLAGIEKLTSNETDFWGWSQVDKIRTFEQQTVHWEEDEHVFERCRFCGQKFSLVNRRHHCRVCGLITCGDLDRQCSFEVPVNMLAIKLGLAGITSKYPLRMCTECRRTLFSLKNYLDECSKPNPPLLQLHAQLKRYQREIDSLMPKFTKELSELNSSDAKKIQTLKTTRHMLLKTFSKYERTVRRARELQMDTLSETAIQQQCLAEASFFMEHAMAPIRSMQLPASMQYNETRVKNKAETTKLQNQLVVLQEQQFLLEKQLDEAKSRRHLDVFVPLNDSLTELKLEIEHLMLEIAKLE